MKYTTLVGVPSQLPPVLTKKIQTTHTPTTTQQETSDKHHHPVNIKYHLPQELLAIQLLLTLLAHPLCDDPLATVDPPTVMETTLSTEFARMLTFRRGSSVEDGKIQDTENILSRNDLFGIVCYYC